MHVVEPPHWLSDLPGVWRGPLVDGGAMLVVCAICRAVWYTRLAAFSQHAIDGMRRHGQEHGGAPAVASRRPNRRAA